MGKSLQVHASLLALLLSLMRRCRSSITESGLEMEVECGRSAIIKFNESSERASLFTTNGAKLTEMKGMKVEIENSELC